jgi:hypothetical protein
MPEHFEQATELVTEEMLAEAVPCGPDLERHAQAIQDLSRTPACTSCTCTRSATVTSASSTSTPARSSLASPEAPARSGVGPLGLLLLLRLGGTRPLLAQLALAFLAIERGDLEPEEIRVIAGRLRSAAGLPKQPTGQVGNDS